MSGKAIREINAKTDLHVQLESLERSRHGRVAALTFAIKARAVPNGDLSPAQKKRKWWAREGEGGVGEAQVVPFKTIDFARLPRTGKQTILTTRRRQ